MARRCRALPVSCFSNCSEAECNVDRVGWRLPGTCWSTLICFWRDIFEPYMPPYMSLRFDIVERPYDHISIKRAIRGRGFFFFHIFFHSLLIYATVG